MLLFFEFVKPLVFTRSPVPVSFACVGAEQSYCSFERTIFFHSTTTDGKFIYHITKDKRKVRFDHDLTLKVSGPEGSVDYMLTG